MVIKNLDALDRKNSTKGVEMTGQSNIYIQCQDLFKIYKIADIEVVALRGLDLNVQPGEVVAIVGASGSGKSTLLNILAGYDSPSAGEVRVGGKDLLTMSSKDLEVYRKTDVGFIWQQTDRNLFPYLTALENVMLPMMLSHTPSYERMARAEELLNLVGLSDRKHHKHDKLSGGEQQRVAIAVALSNKPSLLLADEPTGELDDVTAADILDLFGRVNNELGTTILIVTHDPDIAYKVGRVVMIRDGKMSTEIRRKVTSFKVTGSSDDESPLEEFILVDGNGRIQIPREFIEEFDIEEKIKIRVTNGDLTLKAERS